MTDDRRQRIEQIYLDALDLPAADRPGFLDRACAGDQALRNEVDALLALQSGAEAFLEQPAIESAARTLADILPALKPPEIHGYKIIRHLGEGGMGLVYLAEQQAPLRRLVALKVIRPGMDSLQVVARFNAERQALAQMDHPNIAAVHDAGATSDGRPFFVMEFVDGLPISEYCDRKALPTVARLELFTQVCAGVQHAHQKGVIHRDLKPSNVLVAEHDGRPMPKVIDFGTAKAIDRSAGDAVTLTAHGMVLGTIEYMSPEQAAFSRDIDTTTDVYSLGVMLYELLVGVLPFERPRPGPEGYDELRRLIRESDPERPSARLSAIAASRAGIASARQTDPDRLRRSLQGDLDWITLKALEKDRTRRYPTVSAFASDIRRFLSDQTVDARPPSAAYRIRKFTRRHRGAVAAAVSLVVVLVAGLVASRWQYLRAEDARIEAESARAAAIAALDLSDYRNYVITIAAADAEVRASRLSDARERLLTVPPARRGWEWEHLFVRAERHLTLADRANPAPCPMGFGPLFTGDNLAKDPDGKRIYFRHCQHVDTWNTETLEHSAVSSVPNVIVAAAPFGRRVEYVLASEKATPHAEKKWNVYVADAIPKLIGTVDRQPACADLSRDGRMLALGLPPLTSPGIETDVFEVWDVENGRRIWKARLPKPSSFDTRRWTGTGCFVRLSPDTTLLAASGAGVGVWVAATGVPAYVDSGQAGLFPQPIAFSPTTRQFAIGRRNGLIDVLDFGNSSRTVKSLDGADVVRLQPLNDNRERFLDVLLRRHEEVRAINFAPDGRTLVSARADRVIVWDLQSARARKMLAAHQSPVTGLVVHEQLVYSSHADAKVKVEELEGWSGITKLAGSTLPFGRVVVSADGRTIAGRARLNAPGDVLQSANGSLRVWHPDERREVVERPRSPTDTAFLVAALSDNRTLLTWRRSVAAFMRWDSETQQAISLPTIPTMEPGCAEPALSPAAAVSPDERAVAMVQGNCVVVRDLATTTTLAILRLDRHGFDKSSGSSVEFLSDGSILVTADHQRLTGRSQAFESSVMRWDWTTKRLTADRVFPTSTDSSAVAVSKDGRRIAVSGEGFVTVWDGTFARVIGRIPIPPNLSYRAYGVQSSAVGHVMALSVDGTRLAMATSDQTSVMVWDTEKSHLLLTLTDDVAPRFLAFTPRGQLIAVNSSGGITIWETQRPKCAHCPKATVPVK